MQKFPDYSDFLDKEGMLEYIESEWKKNEHIHRAQAELVNKVVEENGILSLTEVGSSTGNMSQFLKVSKYTGIDKNESSVLLAREKNKDKEYHIGDIRSCKNMDKSELVCAFAIMKHFGLHEWSDILDILAYLSTKIVVIDVPIANKTFDDGEQHGHHHVWFNIDDLIKVFKSLRLEIVRMDYSNSIEPIFILKKI